MLYSSRQFLCTPVSCHVCFPFLTISSPLHTPSLWSLLPPFSLSLFPPSLPLSVSLPYSDSFLSPNHQNFCTELLQCSHILKTMVSWCTAWVYIVQCYFLLVQVYKIHIVARRWEKEGGWWVVHFLPPVLIGEATQQQQVVLCWDTRTQPCTPLVPGVCVGGGGV